MRLRLVISASLFVAFFLPAYAQDKVSKCTGPQEACQQVVEMWKGFDAVSSRDAAAAAAFFTQDGIWLLPGAPLSGRTAIEKQINEQIKAGWGPDTATVDEVHVAEDIAWVTGHWSELAPGSKQLQGSWGSVHVREGGSWKIRMSTVNITPS
jgi:uncharacterized protein (TIGR02246 family)